VSDPGRRARVGSQTRRQLCRPIDPRLARAAQLGPNKTVYALAVVDGALRVGGGSAKTGDAPSRLNCTDRRQIPVGIWSVAQPGSGCFGVRWQCPATICTWRGWFTQTVDGAYAGLGNRARHYQAPNLVTLASQGIEVKSQEQGSSIMTNRIIDAGRLREGVYAEVAKDTSFTPTTRTLVVVGTFLNQLGSCASSNLLS
jgi:hypothetical protein